jgi:hypothetical protein
MARMALGDPRTIKGKLSYLKKYIYIILLLKINTKQNNKKIHFPSLVLPSRSNDAKVLLRGFDDAEQILILK